jgi:hypothetical protein
MTETERRATPRYRIEPGSFAYYALGTGILRDLSLASVFVEDTQNSFTVDTEIDLELHLDEERIPVRGTVRRSVPGRGFAVQFRTLSSDARERLEKYFRKHFGPH